MLKPIQTCLAGVEFKYSAVGCIFGIKAGDVLWALGLFDPFPRRPDRRDLLLLSRQRAERLGYEVRVR